MAQGKIKKGFFFYFGLFVLLLIAVFMIILVILMFNPGKTILWFQYFTSDSEPYEIVQTTDTKETIDLSSTSTIENIEVDCSYADVIIQKSNKIRKDCIVIENNAKGFATSQQAREFSYSVVKKDQKTLAITVIEPVGFIYLSSDITITINIFYNESDKSASGDFSNIGFNIKTTDGNVDVGGSTFETSKIAPKNIYAETTKGDIILRGTSVLSNAENLSFKTDNGGIVTIDSCTNGIGLNNGNITLSTNKGTIDFDIIKVNNSGKVYVHSNSGNIVCDNLEADTIEINCYEGNFRLGEVNCQELTFTPSENRIISPNVIINKLVGDFILSSSESANPDIEIGVLEGNIDLHNISGSIKVGEIVDGYVYATLKNANFEVAFANQTTSTNDNYIADETGSTTAKITFKGAFINNMKVITNNGNISFNFKPSTIFIANSYINDGENFGQNDVVPESLDDNKISTNIGNTSKNPLEIEGTGARGKINIYTNANVSFTVA